MKAATGQPFSGHPVVFSFCRAALVRQPHFYCSVKAPFLSVYGFLFIDAVNHAEGNHTDAQQGK